MVKSLFNIEYAKGHTTYVFNTLTSSFIKTDTNDWNNPDGIDTEAKEVLYNNGFLVNSHEEELNEYKCDFYASIFKNSRLILYITPTMRCNFNCFYCFEEGHKKQGKMKKEIEGKVVDFLVKNKEKPIDIIWFGGEPLLGFDVMLSISQRIKEQGVNYTSSMITNGSLLTPDKIAQLDDLHLTFIQMSMDGVQKDQDSRRCFKDGRPSFDIIMNNIKCLLETTNIPLTIQVTVDKTNPTGFDDLNQYCYEHFTSYYNSKRIQVGFNHVRNRTGFDVDNKCFSAEDLISRAKNDISMCQNCAKSDYLPEKSLACGYRAINTLSIDAEGYVYPCLEYMGNPTMAIGSLKDNKISIKKIKQCALQYNPFEDEECKVCPVLPLCGGGCPRDYEKENVKEIRCTHYKKHLAELLPLMAQ